MLGAFVGSFLLAHTVMMWAGGMVVTPLGFLFGLGESEKYETTLEDLTNLFWHVIPGIAGFGLSVVSFITAGLLFWGSPTAWRRVNQPRGESAS